MHFALALEHDVVIEIRPRRKPATARVLVVGAASYKVIPRQGIDNLALKARAIVAGATPRGYAAEKHAG